MQFQGPLAHQPIEAVWAVHGLHAGDSQTPFVPGLLDGSVTGKLPGVPAILVKPKTIADAYKLRGEYRGDATMAVFPGEVLTGLYATLGDARSVMSFIAIAAQILVAAAIALIAISHVHQRRRQIGALRAEECGLRRRLGRVPPLDGKRHRARFPHRLGGGAISVVAFHCAEWRGPAR
jgi:hypothetical protein